MIQTFNRRSARLLVVFVLVIAALGMLPFTPAQAAVITINEPFTGSAPGWSLLGSAELTYGAPYGLQLTAFYTNTQRGAAFYNSAFPGDSTFDVEFDYLIYGGDGADGMTFFMIDGTATPSNPGDYGGGLGYQGIEGAYFAVVLNEYGGDLGGTPYIGVWDSSELTSCYNTSVTLPANAADPGHAHITFNNKHISVWLKGEQVIFDCILAGTLPARLKFGFSAGTGGLTNSHNVSSAIITVTPPPVLRVESDGTANYPCGDSWTSACSLQTALANVYPGSDIWVASGIYRPTESTSDRSASFQLRSNVAVYGGFDGVDDAALADRDPMKHGTVLSGDIANDDSQWGIIYNLETVTGNDNNSYHVVKGANNATLDGFIITGGYTDTGAGGVVYAGGGMLNDGTSPTVRNVIFMGNQAYSSGGGMANYNSASPVVEQSSFVNNSATVFGGGMSIYDSSNATIRNVTFSGNSAERGGAVITNAASATFTNVTFSRNSADYTGGLYNDYGNVTLRNSIFWANISDDYYVELRNFGTMAVYDSVVQSNCPLGITCTRVLTTDPKLGPLGFYGGFTQTIPLLHGSSAHNATSTSCTLTDQRGVIRGSTCDIGAFEGEFYPLSLPLVMR